MSDISPLSEGRQHEGPEAGFSGANGRVLYFEQSMQIIPKAGSVFPDGYPLVEVCRRTYPGETEPRWIVKPNLREDLEYTVDASELPKRVVKKLERKAQEASDETTRIGRLLGRLRRGY